MGSLETVKLILNSTLAHSNTQFAYFYIANFYLDMLLDWPEFVKIQLSIIPTKFVDEYNNNRYHAGIGYLKPVDVFHGRGPAILAERKEKLKQARQERFARNTELNRILMGEIPA